MCWLFLGVYMGWVQAVYGDKAPDIPETAPDSASYLEEPDITGDIPDFYRAFPAVLEAELLVQGKSKSRPITDGRVVR